MIPCLHIICSKFIAMDGGVWKMVGFCKRSESERRGSFTNRAGLRNLVLK